MFGTRFFKRPTGGMTPIYIFTTNDYTAKITKPEIPVQIKQKAIKVTLKVTLM